MGEAKFIVVAVIFSLSLVFSVIAMATDFWYQFETKFWKQSKGLWKDCGYTQGILNLCTPNTDAFMRPVKSLAVCAGVCVLGAIISVILSRVMKERALIFLIITAVSGGVGTILIVAALLKCGLTVIGFGVVGSWTGITKPPLLGWSYYVAAVHACLAFLGTVVTIIIIIVGLVMARRGEDKDRRQAPANRRGPPLPSKQRR